MMPVTINFVAVRTLIHELVSFQVLELLVTLVFLNENTHVPFLLCIIFSAELFCARLLFKSLTNVAIVF